MVNIRAPIATANLHCDRLILKLLGLDHRKLTFLFEGRNMRLTDVGGDNDIAQKLVS